MDVAAPKMPGLLIIAHAPLASALKTLAEHTFPDCGHRLRALDVPPDMSPDDAEVRARTLLREVRDPCALILTDVFGATPSNVALRLSDAYNVKVVAGVNVPMLWRTLCYADQPLESLVACAVAGATQGVMPIASSRPQNQANKPGGNDPENHHHQQ